MRFLTTPIERIAVALAITFVPALMAADVSVHGRVMGQTEAGEHLGAVVSAKVEFQDGQGKTLASVTTGEGGYYSIASLQTGSYKYHLVADGYREEKAGRGFTLTADGAHVLDFVMTKGSNPPAENPPKNQSPTGKKSNKPQTQPAANAPTPNNPMITNAPNATAPPEANQGQLSVRVVQANETPVPGAVVMVRGSEGGAPAQRTTGPKGMTRFGLDPGAWRAAAKAPGFALRVHPDPIVMVADGKQQITIVLQPQAEPTADPSVPAGDGTQAKFFGAKSAGKRVAYLVDNSLSMKDGRFQTATDELIRSIRGLSDRQKFYVIFFSDTLHPMYEPQAPADMLPADWLNIARLEKYVADVKLAKGTNARPALEKAYSLKPDIIYILTDGMFTDDSRKFLHDMPEKKVPIHTIGFQPRERGGKGLKNIAEQHQGTYTEVP